MLDPAGGLKFPHAGHRGRRATKLLAPMHQGEALGGRSQCHGPVQRRVPAAENDQPPPRQLLGIAHPILDLIALKGLGAGHSQSPGLEGAQAGRDDHRTNVHYVPPAVPTVKRPAPSGISVVTSSPR